MTTHVPLQIVPYMPQWPEDFRVIAGRLRDALGHLALRIDHIGSTAVADLAAKDIIDIQVAVAALHPSEPLLSALAGIGYTPYPDIARDHVPANMDGAAEQWTKLFFWPPPGQRPTNLHVRVEGRANQRYALLFRDYLRAHPIASGSYALVKRALTQYCPDDWDAYYDVKDPVCDIIIAAAEEWAAATSWSPGPSDA